MVRRCVIGELEEKGQRIMLEAVVIKSKCDDCTLKKWYAKYTDIHWFGETDCPFDKCTKDIKKGKENE